MLVANRRRLDRPNLSVGAANRRLGTVFVGWAKIFQPTKKNEKILTKLFFSTRFQKFPFFSKTERFWPKFCRLGQNFPTDEKKRKKFPKLFFSTRFQKFLFCSKIERFCPKFCWSDPDFVGWTEISQPPKKKIRAKNFFLKFSFSGGVSKSQLGLP